MCRRQSANTSSSSGLSQWRGPEINSDHQGSLIFAVFPSKPHSGLLVVPINLYSSASPSSPSFVTIQNYEGLLKMEIFSNYFLVSL